jgi:lipopolysaccharide heptosyltransferase II
MKPDNIKRILLISTTGIGNTIFFTPVIKNCRKIFQGAKISFLATDATGAVVSGTPFIDEIIYYRFKNRINKYISQFQLLRYLRQQKFDMTICAFSERSTIKFNLLSYFTGAPRRLGVKRNNKDFLFTHAISPTLNKHEVLKNLEILETVTEEKLSDEPFFWVNEDDRIFVKRWLKRIITNTNLKIGIHPGCTPNQLNKRWNPDNYIKLGKLLFETYKANIIIFGGPEEKELANKISAGIPSSFVVAGETTLKQTAALLETCDLYIGHDSGVLHIASTQRIPIIALFGPTSSVIYGPYCNDKHIINAKKSENNAMDSISVDEVFEVASEKIRLIIKDSTRS